MKKHSYLFATYFIGVLFFVFGFITWINSVLIPFLKLTCELSDFAVYLVTFAFYISYFVMALPSSWVLKKIGFVKGMSCALFVMALGSLIFIPAAMERNYLLFLIGLFTQGAGLALLQTAVNPYVTILGPIESAAQRISIMGICNKIAGIAGILLLSYMLFSDIKHIEKSLPLLHGAEREAALNTIASQIVNPYIIIAVSLFILGAIVRFVHLPKVELEANVAADDTTKKQKTLKDFPYMWLGVVTIFLYVGVEVMALDTLPLFGEYMGLDTLKASTLGTFGLLALVVGYIAGIITVPKYISQRNMLAVCAILDIIFLAGALMTTGMTSIVFIILLSLAHAMMWPGIWPLAIEGLGKYTAIASALLIMGIAGGALLPLGYAAWCDALEGNRQLPYLIMLPCYLFILYYAIKGCKLGKK